MTKRKTGKADDPTTDVDESVTDDGEPDPVTGTDEPEPAPEPVPLTKAQQKKADEALLLEKYRAVKGIVAHHDALGQTTGDVYTLATALQHVYCTTYKDEIEKAEEDERYAEAERKEAEDAAAKERAEKELADQKAAEEAAASGKDATVEVPGPATAGGKAHI